MKFIKKYWLHGTIFLLGVIIGVFYSSTFLQQDSSVNNFRTLRLSDPKYKLISPLLLAGITSQGNGDEFKTIENKLKLLTYDELNVPGIDTISVYYKDLQSGLWAGIAEDTGYDPASLLKVPIMIAWFKKEEAEPGTLNQKLVWKGSPNDGKGVEFFDLTPGQSYSVDYLIKYMIEKSDNDAKNLLIENLDSKTLDTVFNDLGIKDWNTTGGNPNRISPRVYSRFLNVLYNATYLDHVLSEKALELLSSSDFKDGLVAGVPAGTDVAHKFGQFTYTDPKSTSPIDPVELHDCGIVYHPKKPYVLCVMTEGKTDLVNLESIISKISSSVYMTVDGEK